MKNKILKWLKVAGISLLWICSGFFLIAIFFGALWISGGSYAGYPALIVVTIIFISLAVFILKEQSTDGRVLRIIPISLALLVSFWCMIPIASDTLEPISDNPGAEILELGNERFVSLSHHTPENNTSIKNKAILFVHGGPGAYVRDFDRSFFAGFSDLGYDVFIYDQVGAGRSPVVDVETYTHQNNVEDLAKIIDKINMPMILIGQSYGTGLITSYLDKNPSNENILKIIFTEPSPLPGKFPQEGPHYSDKTTIAEHVGDPSPLDIINSPRFLLAMALPAGNQLVSQQEIMNYIGPEIQEKVVASSFCKEDENNIPHFEKLPVNLLANRFIRSSFMEEETPDLRDLDIPVMILLGECSNIPRGYAMDYFDVYSISRSHAISGVGHILWGNKKGQELTREAILSFLNDSEMPLPNEPDKDSRYEFIEQGK